MSRQPALTAGLINFSDILFLLESSGVFLEDKVSAKVDLDYQPTLRKINPLKKTSSLHPQKAYKSFLQSTHTYLSDNYLLKQFVIT